MLGINIKELVESTQKPPILRRPAASAEADPEYFYGYDAEFKKVWRASTTSKASREFCPNPLQIPAGAKATDHPLSIWPGSTTPIPIVCLTVADLQAAAAVVEAVDARGIFWSTNKADGDALCRVHVTKRADRDPMAALYETSTRAPEQPDKKQTKEQSQVGGNK